MAKKKSGKSRGQIVIAKIETDNETYVKISQDQTCLEPLIPKKSPTKDGRA